MAAWRLTLATGEPRCADHAERALDNMVATSVTPDGDRFLYVDPLQSRAGLPVPSPQDVPFRQDTPRASWFWVSCCPTSVARLLTSLGAYVATTDDSGLQLHQYVPGAVRASLDGDDVAVRVRTDYPWNGRIEVEVSATGDRPWTLGLRVPGWASATTVEVDGSMTPVDPGTHEVRRAWSPGDVVVLDLHLQPRTTVPDPRIDALRGTVAVDRGPLVYCAEDPGGDADVVPSVDPGTTVRTVPCAVPGADPGALSLEVDGRVSALPAPGAWPYGHPAAGADRAAPITLVPLHLWGLGESGPMRVFLPVGASGAAPQEDDRG